MTWQLTSTTAGSLGEGKWKLVVSFDLALEVQCHRFWNILLFILGGTDYTGRAGGEDHWGPSWKLASSHLGTHTLNSLSPYSDLVIIAVLNEVPFALVKYELSHLMLIENAIFCHLVSSVIQLFFLILWV